PGEPGGGRLLRADGPGDQPRRLGAGGEDRGAARRRPRLQDDRRDHEGDEPARGRAVPRSAPDEPHDARDVLPDGGSPRAPVHAPRLCAGGVGTVATIQLFTDYSPRLMRYVEFLKRIVPLHDDLFDFFYQALPGYEKVGLRRTLLGCWGAFQDPDVCNFEYRDMTRWGRSM